MNRRQFLAGLGASAAIAGGYAGVRLGDLRPYNPSLPTGESPRERIIAAAAQRFAIDHRVVSKAEIRRDWTGDAPYDLGIYRQWHEHSRRRHLHALTTFDSPLFANISPDEAPGAEFLSPHGSLPALLHYNRAFSAEDLPLTYVTHITDGTMLYDYDAPTPPNDPTADEIAVSSSEGRSGVAPLHGTRDPLLQEYIRPHRTTWNRVGETDTTVTFRIATPEAYAQVVPLAITAVKSFFDPFLEVTLDRETGRLRRVLDHRDVEIGLWYEHESQTSGQGENSEESQTRLTYRIETVFDQYGTASAPRPASDTAVSLETRAKGFLSDLLTY